MAAKTSQNGSVANAAEVADRVANKGYKSEMELSNGLILRVKPVPPLALREAAVKIEAPKIPMWTDPEKDREEPNPNDPDYIAAVKAYEEEQLLVITDVMLVLGTEVAFCPEFLIPIESDDWIDQLSFVGIEIDKDSKYARYLAWLKFYAVESNIDIALLTATLIGNAGVTEKEVQNAVAAFRNTSARRAN